MWLRIKSNFIFIQIDSIYRNELMDDILNLLKLVKNSRLLLEDKLKNNENKMQKALKLLQKS